MPGNACGCQRIGAQVAGSSALFSEQGLLNGTLGGGVMEGNCIMPLEGIFARVVAGGCGIALITEITG